MARGEAGIDHCPPGGDAGARALARVLGVPAKPYDRSRGEHKPPQVAVVVEADCIGCTKCIQACPVDAIIGASSHARGHRSAVHRLRAVRAGLPGGLHRDGAAAATCGGEEPGNGVRVNFAPTIVGSTKNLGRKTSL
jgi:ferredoxin